MLRWVQWWQQDPWEESTNEHVSIHVCCSWRYVWVGFGVLSCSPKSHLSPTFRVAIAAAPRDENDELPLRAGTIVAAQEYQRWYYFNTLFQTARNQFGQEEGWNIIKKCLDESDGTSNILEKNSRTNMYPFMLAAPGDEWAGFGILSCSSKSTLSTSRLLNQQHWYRHADVLLTEKEELTKCPLRCIARHLYVVQVTTISYKCNKM